MAGGEPAVDDSNRMIPLENYGIQVMSVGFLLPADDPHKPIIWRGPLLQKALNQLLHDVGATTLPLKTPQTQL